MAPPAAPPPIAPLDIAPPSAASAGAQTVINAITAAAQADFLAQVTVAVSAVAAAVAFVPRGGADHQVTSVDARAYAFDTDHGRIALVTPDSQVDLSEME